MAIRLPDFTKSEILNDLRKKMGNAPLITFSTETKYTGRLSAADLELLRTEGIEISFDQIEILEDGSFTYEGVRIVGYIVEPTREGLPKFHVIDCQKMQSMRLANRADRYIATNRTDGKFVINKLMQDGTRSRETIRLDVCRYCLDELEWKSFSIRNMKPFKKDKIVASFLIVEYFEKSHRPFHNAPKRKGSIWIPRRSPEASFCV